MGRQVLFYILDEDHDAFVETVKQDGLVRFLPVDSESAELGSFDEFDKFGSEHSQTLCLWNQTLLPALRRDKKTPSGLFRIDVHLYPVLEFETCARVLWDGRPALTQGRLYASFEGKHADFEKWFQKLARWIRKHYHRNPTNLGGYVGPAALEFFRNGGHLLPGFCPPPTDAWLREIRSQHAAH